MTTWRTNQLGETICNAHARKPNADGECEACNAVDHIYEKGRVNEQYFEDAMLEIGGPIHTALRGIWNKLEELS